MNELKWSSDVDKAPADPAARAPPPPKDVQNTDICCGFFQTGSRSPDRKQQLVSLLWVLGKSSPKI